MADAATLVRQHVEPLADDAGVDVVGVEVKGAGAARLVRVRVDRKGGVDLAVCQRLSQTLASRLDRADGFDGPYRLEVTSPGIDHPLRDRRDFDRVEGRAVRIRRRCGDAVDELVGTVREAGPDAVVVDTGATTAAVAYDEILAARQTLPW